MTGSLSLSIINKEMKVLSKELQSALIALLVLFSIYITSVLVILIVLTKVSQTSCIRCPYGLENCLKEITSISPQVGSLRNSSPN